jgi:hypothetical protein
MQLSTLSDYIFSFLLQNIPSLYPHMAVNEHKLGLFLIEKDLLLIKFPILPTN